jgi:hypothetical protein
VAYDLMVVDVPGARRERQRADRILRDLRGLATLSYCEMHSNYCDPGDLDCEELAELLEENEDALERFRSLCAAHALDEGTAKADPATAAWFLDLDWGVTLVTAKMPIHEPEVAAAYASLLEFVRQHHLGLWDPQAGANVDLANPGRLPPMWR